MLDVTLVSAGRGRVRRSPPPASVRGQDIGLYHTGTGTSETSLIRPPDGGRAGRA